MEPILSCESNILSKRIWGSYVKFTTTSNVLFVRNHRQECCYPRENRKGLVTFNTDIFLFARTVDRNARGLTGKNVNTVYSG